MLPSLLMNLNLNKQIQGKKEKNNNVNTERGKVIFVINFHSKGGSWL